MSTAASPVRMVNLYSGFDIATMTVDGVHPNRVGDAQNAARFFAAMRPQLTCG